ncbi:MAG: flagellar biosynthetic protein FliR [Ignavibacteriales bacterium]|nr:flagellar biosynthetic protein FliR [Ignavibacteriales bacterium]
MINILVNDFVVLILVFLRVVPIFFVAPFFNSSSIPNTVKILFALIVSYIIFFSIKGFTFDVNKGLLLLALYGAKEVVTGLIIGFSINFIFYGISFAGSLIGFDMGLSMASAFDPSMDMENNIIGQLLNLIAILIFLTINGHHYVIRALSYSFSMVPIGEITLSQSLLLLLVKYSAGVFILAVKIASPLMISFFLIHVAAGITARIIPQMQVFFVIQPLQIAIGFILLAAFSPVIVLVIKNILAGYEDTLFELIKAMGK